MPEKRLEKTRESYCDHKFVDSKICLKCGISIDELNKITYQNQKSKDQDAD